MLYVFQDEYYPVRYGYLQKLHKYLLRRRHAARWFILPFLVAHDVEQDVKDIVSGLRIVRIVRLLKMTSKYRVSRSFGMYNIVCLTVCRLELRFLPFRRQRC